MARHSILRLAVFAILLLGPHSLAVAGDRDELSTADPSFDVEEVSFRSLADGIELAGTLTVPAGDGPFPAAVPAPGHARAGRAPGAKRDR